MVHFTVWGGDACGRSSRKSGQDGSGVVRGRRVCVSRFGLTEISSDRIQGASEPVALTLQSPWG